MMHIRRYYNSCRCCLDGLLVVTCCPSVSMLLIRTMKMKVRVIDNKNDTIVMDATIIQQGSEA